MYVSMQCFVIRKAKAAFLPDKTVYCNQHAFRAADKVCCTNVCWIYCLNCTITSQNC